MKKIANLFEQVWIRKEKPNLTNQLFGDTEENLLGIANGVNYHKYAYAVFQKTNNSSKKIIGWYGSSLAKPYIGYTNKFKNIIENKIPVRQKRLAFYFSLFTQSFEPTKNTLTIFEKKDNQTLVTDKLFPVTNGLVMWRHQMEELFQYVGFSEIEAQKMQKDFQQGLRKDTAKKLREVKINSLSLYEILQNRVPPKKASILNYSTSKYFYDHFVKPKLN